MTYRVQLKLELLSSVLPNILYKVEFKRSKRISSTATAVLSITISILYFNYHENTIRMETRKKGAILDHWGKGAPSKEEIAALEESLRREMEEFGRQEAAEKKQEAEAAAEEEEESGRQFKKDMNILGWSSQPI